MVSRFDLSDLKIDDRKRRRRGLGWLRWFAALLGAALLAFAGWSYLQNRPPAVTVASTRAAGTGPVTLRLPAIGAPSRCCR